MVSAWREIRDVASPQTRFTPFALPSQEQAKLPSPFGSLPTPTVPKPISQSLRSPLAAACVLWPLIEHCCALFSRVSLIGRALCLSEALVSFRRQKAPERRFSCRLAWAVCLRSLLRAISDMRVSVRLLLKDLSGRGQSRVRYVLFAFPPLRAYGPAPQTSPYL